MMRRHPKTTPVFIVTLFAAGQVFAAPPIINYQGRLTDGSGNNPIVSAVTLKFSFFGTATGGTPLGPNYVYEVVATPNSQGFVSVLIGGSSGNGGSIPKGIFSSDTVYLNVNVRTQGMVTGEDLSPRILLESVPYSFYSDNAAEASHAVLADNATHASTATNATNATTSVNATNAVHAISADNSTTATTASMANTATTANNALNLGGQAPSFYGVPPGTIVAFGGDTPPAGWLLCDGSTVRASVYPALFAAIGNSWGHGENTPEDTDPDTFSLPDLRGFLLRGVGGDDARNPDRNSRANIRYGGNQGDQVGTWEWDTLQRHRHRIGLFSSPEMNSPHKTARGASINSEYSSAWSTNHPQTIDTGIEGNVVDPWGNQLGARFSTETRPKNAAVHFIIKP